MSENIEQTIAQLAKERAKTILENGDFWGSPGAANTSATAITTLIALNVPVTNTSANAVATAIADALDVVSPPKRGPKPKEQTQTPEPNGESEPADA